MTEKEIRAEILRALADLYEDWPTRAQFQRFVFAGADQQVAQSVLNSLSRHLLIEQKAPDIARLTELGYRLLKPEINRLREAAGPAPMEAAPSALPPPAPAEIHELSQRLGGADYASASVIVEGRFVVDWADEGFKRVIGYTAEELELAGGWPAVIRDVSHPSISGLFERLLSGETVSGELTIVARGGNLRTLRFISRPRFDESGSRIVGSIGVGRVVSG